MVDIAIGALILATQAVRRVYADLTVRLHQFGKVFPIHKAELARGRRLGGDFVRHSRNRGAEPYGFSGLHRFQNQDLALPRGAGEVHLTRANDEQPARRLPFYKQDRSRRQNAFVADAIDGMQRCLGHGAKYEGFMCGHSVQLSTISKPYGAFISFSWEGGRLLNLLNSLVVLNPAPPK